MNYAQQILTSLTRIETSLKDLGQRLEVLEQANQFEVQLAAPITHVSTPKAQSYTRSTLTAAEKKQKYNYAGKYIRKSPELITDIAEMRKNNKTWSRIAPLLSREHNVPEHAVNHAFYLAEAQGAVVNNEITDTFERLYL